jgi:hypothetical protein
MIGVLKDNLGGVMNFSNKERVVSPCSPIVIGSARGKLVCDSPGGASG